MRILISFVLILVASRSFAQMKSDIVIVMLENKQIELIESIRSLKPLKPKLIALDLNLECEDETHMQLTNELATTENLLLPSEVVPFGSSAFRDVIGCSLLYPNEMQTGFTNLLENHVTPKLIDQIQIKNVYKNKVSYHMAVKIALTLDPKQAHNFLNNHSATLSVELEQMRSFPIYGFEDLVKGKLNGIIDKNKIVNLTIFPSDFFLVRESYFGDLKKCLHQKFMRTSPTK